MIAQIIVGDFALFCVSRWGAKKVTNSIFNKAGGGVQRACLVCALHIVVVI